MLKKIETFLMIMLALCAVLLLLATSSRRTAPAGEETTASTVQTTAPTEGTAAPTTQPETQTPAKDPEPAQTAPAPQARERVEQILEQASLEQTAVTRRVVDPRLNSLDNTDGLKERSHAYALTELAEGWKMNPVAAFWELVSAGLYEKQADGSGVLPAAAIKAPEKAAEEYAYSNEGVRQLLSEMLSLAARMEDGLDLEVALLASNLTVEGDQVFHSEAEQCRYAYFSCTTDRAEYILCFYFRGEERINDVELQLLYLRHASGDAEALAMLDRTADHQAASLMAAAELLMTGKTRAGEGNIPFTYEIGGARATLERFTFVGDPDRGCLTNYRLRVT